jgi:hypothetical protein
MSDTKPLREALIRRVLDGDARASAARRKAAFDNAGTTDPSAPLVDKVAREAWKITDADVGAVKAKLPDDEIFELVVCAAVGQATRQLDAALAALAAVDKADKS